MGGNLTFRKLEKKDFDRGFMKNLEYLSIVGHYDRESWEKRFEMIQNKGYRIIVWIDEDKDMVVASGSVFFESKFIRSLGTWGHLEDVSVHEEYRDRKLGLHMIYKIYYF